MKSLQQIVRVSVVSPAVAGHGADTAFDRTALQRELQQLRRSRDVLFWCCVAALVVVFVLAVWFIIAHRDEPKAIVSMSTATGLGLTGIIALMTKLWQTKVKSDLVIAMCSAVSEKVLREVLVKLVSAL